MCMTEQEKIEHTAYISARVKAYVCNFTTRDWRYFTEDIKSVRAWFHKYHI